MVKTKIILMNLRTTIHYSIFLWKIYQVFMEVEKVQEMKPKKNYLKYQ